MSRFIFIANDKPNSMIMDRVEKGKQLLVPNVSPQNAAEIVFFDLETTVPARAGGRFWVLEFGAIVVCPRQLVELESYCTLIRPRDLSVVTMKSGRADGITREAVATAPMFEDIAERIFRLLSGRVWAGHNIHRFDCARIREAFADIGRPAPVPVGTIDSLGVLTQKFGRRACSVMLRIHRLFENSQLPWPSPAK